MSRAPRKLLSLGIKLALVATLGLLVACGGGSNAASSQNTSPSPSASPPALKNLKVEPDTGHIGDSFTVSGEALPPGKPVEFVWVTSNGDYVTQVELADVKFIERAFPDKRVSLGKSQTDSQGRVSATFTAPDDYGETHDILAVFDGQDTAKGGFRIMRTVDFSPTQGPVGIPITITIKGLGPKTFESTMAALYDHKYTGFITAVKTRGTAVFQIRATGPVGPHLVEVIGAATAAPYLNNWQSPTSYIPWEFRTTFTATEDRGAPADTAEWPEAGRVAVLAPDAPRTGLSNPPSGGVQATLEPSVGPNLTHASLKASGLPANVDVELVWVTAAGSDIVGWDVAGVSLLKTRTGGDGTLNSPLEIPEGLGGWHVVKVVQGDKVLAEAPFRVDRRLIEVSPKRVKAGEMFKVEIKGVGWTQIDNGVAVLYDNSYIGFACGFGTGGDVTLNLVATGGPGTHLIDLYPMIYQGARGLKGTAKPPWLYQIPFLTALQDYPGLALGYNLPIFRLAIEVVE